MGEPFGKREAQHEADRIRAFRDVLSALVRDGVLALTEEQRQAVDSHLDSRLHEMAARFDVDVSERQQRLSVAMRILSALGGLAFCAAVVMLFQRYWGLLPTWTQMAFLIAAPILGVLAMRLMVRRERSLYFTGLIGLVTFAAFLLNLTVAAEVFNMVSSPNAFAAWSAFALLLAYHFRLRLLLVAGLICGVIFLAGVTVTLTGAWWEGWFKRPEIVVIAGGVLVAIAAWQGDFSLVYRMTGLSASYFAVLVLGNNGAYSVLPLTKGAAEAFYQLAGFAAAVAGMWQGGQRRWNPVLYLSAGFFVVLLFSKYIDWWWEWMPKYLFFTIVGLTAIAILITFQRMRRRLTKETA